MDFTFGAADVAFVLALAEAFPVAALVAAALAGAALGAEAFFSAGLEPPTFAAAFGAGAGVFEDPAAPDPEGADAGFFFSSFLAAKINEN